MVQELEQGELTELVLELLKLVAAEALALLAIAVLVVSVVQKPLSLFVKRIRIILFTL